MTLSTDFAFEGFRIIRQRPLLIVIWGLFLVVGMGLGYGSFFAMAGSHLMQLIDVFKAGEHADPAAVLAVFGAIIPAALVALVIVGVVQIMLKCAVYRMAFDTRQTSFGALRFGNDELLQIGVGILYFFVYMGVDIGLSIATGIVGVVLSLVFTMISKDLAMIGPLFGMLVHYAVLIWFVCRMSLYSAQTWDEKRVNLFGTWALTNGNFWHLLLGYIIAGVLLVVVYLLCATVFGAGFAVLALSHPMPQLSDPAALVKAWQTFLPLIVLGGIAMLIILPLVTAIMFGAPAAAYRQLTRRRAGAANVF